MKKKGFTLIELLAVILILAIIAVIVTPIISKIIDEAKVQSDKRSAEKFVRAAQTFFMESQMDDEKADLLDTNILDVLDLENVDAVGSVVAYSDGTVDMAIVIGKRCYTKTASQDLKDIQVSKDIDNCTVASSSVKVASINSGTDSIVITVDSTDLTMTSCKYGTTRGELNNDGTIDGNTCTIPESVAGKRYYYKITFSDGTTRSGSVQGQAGLINPNINQSGNGSTGSGNGGSSSGGSGSGGSGSGGVAAPILTEANGRTIYTGTMLANATPIYWDVTTGTKCDVVDFTANGGNTTAEMNSGCLKFWAYMEDGLSYTAVLDRGFSATEYQWASSGNNGLGPVTVLAALKEITDNWNGLVTPKNYTYVYLVGGTESAYRIPYETNGYHARLITTDEVARITRNTVFNPVSTDANGWFYLDGYASEQSGATWQTQIATASQKSAFYWLYSYLGNCENYGCNINASRRYGIWTSDAAANTTDYAWIIDHTGKLRVDYSYYDYRGGKVTSYYNGIRPVVTILKSALN